METLHDTRCWLIYLYESGLFTPKQLYQFLEELKYTDLVQAVHHLLVRTKREELFYRWQAKYPRHHFEELYRLKRIYPLTVLDDDYPKRLLEIYQAPPVLFVQGHKEWLPLPSLAVVGCRECTAYGKPCITKLTPKLSRQLPIVSGLARGIDSHAHRAAIHAEGRTIAVIGTGLAKTYPSEHRSLQAYIAANHCLISPLPYYAGVRRYHFPFRNQVIAGISVATLVIEAKLQSGSLITANYALQYNREVMAVPGRLTDLYSEGCNALIQAGAATINQPEDILQTLENLILN